LTLVIAFLSIDYPWVKTPLSNTRAEGNFSVYVLTVVR
jgi:hypothetical protein